MIEDLIRNSAKEVQNYSDKGFVWDYIKMQVRSATIKFARQYYIDQKSEEIELSKRLEHLQKQYILNDEPCEEIQIIKKQLEYIQTRRANGAKIMEIEDGEKNTAYFLSLEKNRAEKSTITTLRLSDKDINRNYEILAELARYYKELYSQPTLSDENDEMFLDSNTVNLNDTERESCEGKITEQECLKALKTFKNRKKPRH